MTNLLEKPGFLLGLKREVNICLRKTMEKHEEQINTGFFEYLFMKQLKIWFEKKQPGDIDARGVSQGGFCHWSVPSLNGQNSIWRTKLLNSKRYYLISLSQQLGCLKSCWKKLFVSAYSVWSLRVCFWTNCNTIEIRLADDEGCGSPMDKFQKSSLLLQLSHPLSGSYPFFLSFTFPCFIYYCIFRYNNPLLAEVFNPAAK